MPQLSIEVRLCIATPIGGQGAEDGLFNLDDRTWDGLSTEHAVWIIGSSDELNHVVCAGIGRSLAPLIQGAVCCVCLVWVLCTRNASECRSFIRCRDKASASCESLRVSLGGCLPRCSRALLHKPGYALRDKAFHNQTVCNILMQQGDRDCHVRPSYHCRTGCCWNDIAC